MSSRMCCVLPWSWICMVSAAMVVAPSAALAGPPGDPSIRLSLDGTNAFTRSTSAATGFAQDTTESDEHETGWTLDGPYYLRSADPLEVGELELKFIYGYERDSGEEEEHEIEFVLEWGVMENNELILEIPVTIGDGKVEGNGDITEFGLHTKFWDEHDGWPAFAMRNLIRIPTGYHSDGVDYLARGLFTWTLIPNTMRLHFNPFAKSVNGNKEDDTRDFQCGAAIGFDYRFNDDLLVIVDYQNFASEEEGHRTQQSLEIGADWEFAEDRILGLQTEFELDGDGHGPDFGARISYIVELEGPTMK